MAKKYARFLHTTGLAGRRVMEGDIVEVEDDGTLERWSADGLVKPSTESAYRNQQQAEADRVADLAEEEPAAPSPSEAMITREDEPGSAPSRSAK